MAEAGEHGFGLAGTRRQDDSGSFGVAKRFSSEQCVERSDLRRPQPRLGTTFLLDRHSSCERLDYSIGVWWFRVLVEWIGAGPPNLASHELV